MREKENNHFKDVFYIMALALVVLGGCATPLGKFNKQEKVVENIQQEKANNDNKKVESGRTFVYAADQFIVALRHIRIARRAWLDHTGGHPGLAIVHTSLHRQILPVVCHTIG